jgi:ketosteroid isomerase-like protein
MLAPAAAQDKATIEKLNDTFVSAFNTGDSSAVGTMYAEDAIALPPGSPP